MKEMSGLKGHFSVLLFFLAGLAWSQEAVSFKAEISRIDSLIAIGAYQEADTALLVLKAELENTSLLKEDTVRLYFSSQRAFIANQLGDCFASIKLGKEDLNLKQEVYGKGDLITLASRRNLGIYLLNCDSLERSKEVLAETVQIHTETYGQPDELYVRALDDLAYIEGKLGNTEVAYELYNRLIDLLSESKGPFYISIIENYSSLLISNEAFDEAAPFFHELKNPMKQSSEYPQFLKDYYNPLC